MDDTVVKLLAAVGTAVLVLHLMDRWCGESAIRRSCRRDRINRARLLDTFRQWPSGACVQ